MTAHRTHQITPALIGDGPLGEGLGMLGLPSRVGATCSPLGVSSPGGPGRFASGELRPEPRSVKAARDFTRTALCQWCAEGPFDAAAVVVVSELVTNAVRYGLAPGVPTSAPEAQIELMLIYVPGCLICVVTDSNPGPPVLVEPAFGEEAGRGLHVVERLSERWGWIPLGAGRKAVWAALTPN